MDKDEVQEIVEGMINSNFKSSTTEGSSPKGKNKVEEESTPNNSKKSKLQ